MPTVKGSTLIRIERPVAQRLKLLKGDIPYDTFITQVLDTFERLSNNEEVKEFVTKYVAENPEFKGMEFRLGLKAIFLLGKRDLKKNLQDLKKNYKLKEVNK